MSKLSEIIDSDNGVAALKILTGGAMIASGIASASGSYYAQTPLGSLMFYLISSANFAGLYLVAKYRRE